MKIDERRVFVSNSVQANLAIDEFEMSGSDKFDKDSLAYQGPVNNMLKAKVSDKNLNESYCGVDSYDNDYYLMNEFLSQKRTETLKETCETSKSEYFYFYCSGQRYKEINEKHLIKQEPMLIEGQLKKALVLLTLAPESDDLLILNELFERNTPIDLKRIECFIRIKRDIIERHAEHLVMVNENKYLFKRSIILQGQLPSNWMKSRAKREV